MAAGREDEDLQRVDLRRSCVTGRWPAAFGHNGTFDPVKAMSDLASKSATEAAPVDRRRLITAIGNVAA